jgi:hypothetical protein
LGKPRLERGTGDISRDVERTPVDLARIDKRENVRVLQSGSNRDLSEEIGDRQFTPLLGTQDLQRHLAPVSDINREVHDSHPPSTDFLLNGVSAAQ